VHISSIYIDVNNCITSIKIAFALPKINEEKILALDRRTPMATWLVPMLTTPILVEIIKYLIMALSFKIFYI